MNFQLRRESVSIEPVEHGIGFIRTQADRGHHLEPAGHREPVTATAGRAAPMAAFGAADLEGLRDRKRTTPLAARTDPMTGMAPARGFLALLGYGPAPRLGNCKLIGLRWA
ncbi:MULTISPECIES: hypothetical protein [unclassified Streptomyces]|uniref:hypothetical protein n=1 Tax=unclassified Streptomyces TaxID=2593676 RepID=UPI002E804D95|nr:hypothetical protein [Streptomyces sp. NBC_00589]WTI35099.1 hypothetical protein OIC96_08940 [Streptomyces sp. NBC_00775]WUB31227.1 hypothetical protein OHA51_40790 [Streptomyces sp. NBC_00589]